MGRSGSRFLVAIDNELLDTDLHGLDYGDRLEVVREHAIDVEYEEALGARIRRVYGEAGNHPNAPIDGSNNAGISPDFFPETTDDSNISGL